MSTNLQSDALLSAQLSVRYGEKPPVLRDVQFAIRRGEVLGLVGQSGSGKSTIAMAILGLLDRKITNAEGTVEFDGVDLLTLRERELRGTARKKDCPRTAESAVVAQSGAEDSHAVEGSLAGPRFGTRG